MRLLAKMYCAGFCAYPFAKTLFDKDIHVLVVAALCFAFGIAFALATAE